uniref:Uncharacterized protein n=1 Tax=Chromera velia CCMP2878 TaxID=1169474 RepID=A0A0G4FT21_9ALVE|eukprot:Cvel_18506.t1-p1 / transcript=Cvel_18506.t1 / gene=Cvel_18506 / organism=Chromera_velia_CCMP2878 / gene_product=hypothetical protein / transcript_product=hypothetical protein / location=Cvel_scaffold1537:339-8711(-) / protein_length=2407 / sequence_SO=supercontig / SO=protein_coding / is_pseudo=false
MWNAQRLYEWPRDPWFGTCYWWSTAEECWNEVETHLERRAVALVPCGLEYDRWTTSLGMNSGDYAMLKSRMGRDWCTDTDKEKWCGFFDNSPTTNFDKCIGDCQKSTRCHYVSTRKRKDGAEECVYFSTVKGFVSSLGSRSARASCGAVDSRLAVFSKVPVAVSAVSERLSYSGSLLSSVDKDGVGLGHLAKTGHYQDALEIDCTQAARGVVSETPSSAWVLSKFEPPAISYFGQTMMHDLFVAGSYVCVLASNVNRCKEERIQVSGKKWVEEAASDAATELNAVMKEFMETTAELNGIGAKFHAECEGPDFPSGYAQWCANTAEVPDDADPETVYRHMCCGGGEGATFVSAEKSDLILSWRQTPVGTVRVEGPGSGCVTGVEEGTLFPDDFQEYCAELKEKVDVKKGEVADLRKSLLKKAMANTQTRAERAGTLELVAGAATCPRGEVLQKIVATGTGRNIEISRTCCSVSATGYSIQQLSHAYVPPTLRIAPDIRPWQGEYCPSSRDETGRLIFKMCTRFQTPQQEMTYIYGRNTLQFNPARMQWCLHGLDVPNSEALCLDSMAAHPGQGQTASAASPGGNSLGVTVIEDMIPLAPEPSGQGDEIKEKPKKPEKPPPPPVVPLKEVNMEDLYAPHCKAHDRQKLHGPLVKDLPEELSKSGDVEETKLFKAASEPLPKKNEEDADEFLFGLSEPAEVGREEVQAADPCGYVLANTRVETTDPADEKDAAGIPFKAVAGCSARIQERQDNQDAAVQKVEDFRESIQKPYDISQMIFSFIGSLTEFELAPYGLGVTLDNFEQIMEMANYVYEKVNTHLDNKVADIEGSYAGLEGIDCDSNAYGVAKTLCDLSCVSDAVRTGNRAIMDRLQNVYDTLLKNLLTYMDYHASYSEALMQWLADLQDWHAQELGKKVAQVGDAVADLSDSLSEEKSNSLLYDALKSCRVATPSPAGRQSLDQAGLARPPNASSVPPRGHSGAESGREALLQCVSRTLGIISTQHSSARNAEDPQTDALVEDLRVFHASAEARLAALPCVGTNLHHSCRDADTQRSVLQFSAQAAAHARRVENQVKKSTEESVGRLEALGHQLAGHQSGADRLEAVKELVKEVHGHKQHVSTGLRQHLGLLDVMGAPSVGLPPEELQRRKEEENKGLRVSGRVSNMDLHSFRRSSRSSLSRVSGSLSTLEREVQLWTVQTSRSLSAVSLWMTGHRKKEAELRRSRDIRKRHEGHAAEVKPHDRLATRADVEEALEHETLELESRSESDKVLGEMEEFSDTLKATYAAVNTYLVFAEGHLSERRQVVSALDDYLGCSDTEPYEALLQRWTELRRAEGKSARLLVRAWRTASDAIQRVAQKLSGFRLPLRLATAELNALTQEPMLAVSVLAGVLPTVGGENESGGDSLLSSSMCLEKGEIEAKRKAGEEWMTKGTRAGLSTGAVGQLLDFVDEMVEVVDLLQARMVEEHLWHPDNQKLLSFLAVQEGSDAERASAGFAGGFGSLPSPSDLLPSHEDAAIAEDALWSLETTVSVWRDIIGAPRKKQRVASARRRTSVAQRWAKRAGVSASQLPTQAEAEAVEEHERAMELIQSTADSLRAAFCSSSEQESETHNGFPVPLQLLQRAEEAMRKKRPAVTADTEALPDSRHSQPAEHKTQLPGFHKAPPPARVISRPSLLQTDSSLLASATEAEQSDEIQQQSAPDNEDEAEEEEGDSSGGELDAAEGEEENAMPAETGKDEELQRKRSVYGECFQLQNQKAYAIAPLFSSASCSEIEGTVLTAWRVEPCGSENPGAGRLRITCSKVDMPPQEVTQDGDSPSSKEPDGADVRLPSPDKLSCMGVSVSAEESEDSFIALASLPQLRCPGKALMRNIALTVEPSEEFVTHTETAGFYCVEFPDSWRAFKTDGECDAPGKLKSGSKPSCFSRDHNEKACAEYASKEECEKDLTDASSFATELKCEKTDSFSWCEDVATHFCVPARAKYSLSAECCDSTGTPDELPTATTITRCSLSPDISTFSSLEEIVCSGEPGMDDTEGGWALSSFQIVPCDETEGQGGKGKDEIEYAVKYTCTYMDLINAQPFTSDDLGCGLTQRPAGVSNRQWNKMVVGAFSPSPAKECRRYLSHSDCGPFVAQRADMLREFPVACAFRGYAVSSVTFESCGYERFPAYARVVTGCAALPPPLEVEEAHKKAKASGLPDDPADPSLKKETSDILAASTVCANFAAAHSLAPATLKSITGRPLQCPTGWYLSSFHLDTSGSSSDVQVEAEAAGTVDSGGVEQAKFSQFVYTCCKSAGTAAYSPTYRQENKCVASQAGGESSGQLELLFDQPVFCPAPFILSELQLIACNYGSGSVPRGLRVAYGCRAPLALPPSVATTVVQRGECRELQWKNAAILAQGKSCALFCSVRAVLDQFSFH